MRFFGPRFRLVQQNYSIMKSAMLTRDAAQPAAFHAPPALTLRPVSEPEASAMLTWRYPPPYALYNPAPDDWLWLLYPGGGYLSLLRAPDELVGVACLGRAAQVAGGDYHHEPALDVGLSLRPDLLGQGIGTAALAALLDYARREREPASFRATVATFNRRSLRLCVQQGFRPVRRFCASTPTGTYTFLQLVRPA
jgi:RimJ/RimL family protein N-acetyltransferase